MKYCFFSKLNIDYFHMIWILSLFQYHKKCAHNISHKRIINVPVFYIKYTTLFISNICICILWICYVLKRIYIIHFINSLACLGGYFGNNCTMKCNETCSGCSYYNELCDTECLPDWRGKSCESCKSQSIILNA